MWLAYADKYFKEKNITTDIPYESGACSLVSSVSTNAKSSIRGLSGVLYL
ncbi:uncharacterized protein DS421_5g145510 [Arachis hypogaea]|nr:uncharacterized protein DS421_5g145510 [Arachis hypogaea]